MSYLALLPWLLFFPTYSFHIYLEINEKGTRELIKWGKKNFFKMFRLDILLLISLFVYFLTHNHNTVNLMLFFMINLYFFVNMLYETKFKGKFRELNVQMVVIYIFVILIPVIFYLITRNFVVTSLIMFGYSFFAYFILIDIKILSNYIVGKIGRNKKR